MKKILACLATCAALQSGAYATPLSFQYVSSVDATAIGLSTSERFILNWTVDSLAADSDPGNPNIGHYALSSASFHIGNNVFTHITPGPNVYNIENNQPGDLAGVGLDGTFVGPSINTYNYLGDGWVNMYTTSTGAWTSDSIVANPATLDGLTMSRIRLSFSNGGPAVQVFITGAATPSSFRNDTDTPFSVGAPEATLGSLFEAL